MDLPRAIGKRIGLLGGTFDPVHNGHLAIAARAKEQCGLDAMVFIPAASPPHKVQRTISALRHRCRMLELACSGRPGCYVSSLEAERLGPSYTVDTLRCLKDYFPPKTGLFFVIGSDSFIDLPNWKKPERLLDFANLVVVSRDSRDAAALQEMLGLSFAAYRPAEAENVYRREKEGCAIVLLDMEPVPVSATEIRRRVRQGRAIGQLVPAAVAAYIKEQRLYEKA